MHSIASVRSSSGAADYFANDNYYSADEHAEAGVWGGEGARALGLEGQVKRDAFEGILNGRLPNGDMVGHTGIMPAVMKAVRVVDECIGRIADAILAQNGNMMITADHGNADMMVDPITGEPFTQHTVNDVPFTLVSENYKSARLSSGILADISPTILDLAGLTQPASMTGHSLINK